MMMQVPTANYRQRLSGLNRQCPQENSRCESQEMQLSRSLGSVYPSFLHRQTTCDPSSRIYYAGYLLKRSNHPVAVAPGNCMPNTDDESPPRSLTQPGISHRTAASFEYGNDNDRVYSNHCDASEEHDHDVFAADWEDAGPPLPLLPVASCTGSAAQSTLKLSTHDSDCDAYENRSQAYPAETVTVHNALATANSKPLRPRNEVFLEVRNEYFEEAGSWSSCAHARRDTNARKEWHDSKQQFQKPDANKGLLGEQQNHQEESEPDRQRLERFWKRLGDFFGVPISVNESTDNISPVSDGTSRTTIITTTHLQTEAKSLNPQQRDLPRTHNYQQSPTEPIGTRVVRSNPIKMPATQGALNLPYTIVNSNGQRQTLNPAFGSDCVSHMSNGKGCFRRSQSDGLQTNPQQQEQPLDSQDEKGHIWRSKYCVLQDNVLYFYRNQADAESPQAKAERVTPKQIVEPSNCSCNNTNTNSSNVIDILARSPIPRKSIISPLNIHTHDDPGHLWEKRVEVQCIGAVRSAETEYGPHSFALLSPSSYTGGNGKDGGSDEAVLSIESAQDKLIMRARNSEEMEEWLFQFHRSIAVYVRTLINIARRPCDLPRVPAFQSSLSSPRRILSHGHGRALSLRRRLNDDRHSADVSSKRIQNRRSTSTGVIPPRRIRQLSDDSIKSEYWSLTFSKQDTADSTFCDSASPSKSSSSVTPQFLPPIQSRGQTGIGTGSMQAPDTTPAITNLCSGTRFLEGNNDLTPEFSAPPSSDPETERPIPNTKHSAGGKYIPPHKRLTQLQQAQLEASRLCQSDMTGPAPKTSRAYIPPHLRKSAASKPVAPAHDDSMFYDFRENTRRAAPQDLGLPMPSLLNLGGCADPRVVAGSIMDSMFVPRKASKLKKEVRTDPFGYRHKASAKMTWDIGAVSECGIRDSNEDSYLVAGNLLEVLNNGKESTLNKYAQHHSPGLFCVFDGHLGDQAARFSAERLTSYLEDETSHDMNSDYLDTTLFVEGIMRRALEKLDVDFCKLCVKEGREWESGTTALLAALVDNQLIVGNLGDARAIACRSVDKDVDAKFLEEQGWSRLPDSDAGSSSRSCMWIEMSETHSPSREDERRRIDMANGWITYEQQIPIAQVHRLNLQDADVFDILQRCFADRYERSPKAAAPQRVVEISRVCGELAVSRALGDRDFKAAFNNVCSTPLSSSSSDDFTDDSMWDSPLFLSFPEDHSRCFRGDLISNIPEFRTLKLGDSSVFEEFFLFACDGLWDVMDPDDAVRVTRDLLFDKKWSAREAAARLAELAVHLGSSDNITVIVLALAHVEE